jgi:hypothetical protein
MRYPPLRRRAEVVTAAASIDKARLRDLRGELGIARLLEQGGELGCQLGYCFGQ